MKRTKPKPKKGKKSAKKPSPAVSFFQPPTGPVRGALFTPLFR